MFDDVGANKRFKDGAVIFYENDPGKVMYVIDEGRVRLTRKSTRESKEIVTTLAVLDKGNFFGEMALFDYGSRSATALAVGDVALKMISRKDLDNEIKRNPELALYFLDKLSRRIRKTNELVELLLVREKLAEALYDQVDALRYPEFL
jgi:CRP/FNR family cyclic AMP-dependent transcriptional regulator